MNTAQHHSLTEPHNLILVTLRFEYGNRVYANNSQANIGRAIWLRCSNDAPAFPASIMNWGETDAVRPRSIHVHLQVQLLYNLVARNGKEPVHRRTLSSVSLPSGGDGISANSGIGSGISNCNDSTEHACIETSLLVASEETIRALHRLTKQAGNNMLEAASKTDFKVAAMWRDRRDALLSAIQQHDGAKLASNAVESENGQNLADNCT